MHYAYAGAAALLLSATLAAADPQITDVPMRDRAVGALKVGMRVMLVRHDGRLISKETGHPRSVARGPGQVGTITRFARRTMTFTSASPAEFTVAFVRFDAQTWHEWEPPFERMKQGVLYSSDDLARLNDTMGPAVKLRAFEAAVTLELLAPAR